MTHIEIIADFEQKLFALHPKAVMYYQSIQLLKETYDKHVVSDMSQFKADYLPRQKRKGYNKDDKAANKVLYILNELKVFSRVGDILNRIKEYEPDFKSGLNTPINALKADDKIEVRKPTGSNRDTFYGFKSWLDENGNIKKEYMYDENTIVSKEYINVEDSWDI